MKMKKISACALASMLSLACLAGCKGSGSGVEIDETKSQLNVGIFTAGVGTTWLANSIKDFEAQYANVSFESGKTGVQVISEEKTEEFKGSNLSSTMSHNENALYFLEQSDYDMFLARDLLADVTDVINADVYDENGNLASEVVVEGDGKWSVKANGTKSIMDTMNDEYVGYHERNGKYYALPYRVHVSGLIYDADLFNEKGYYFFNNGEMGAKQTDIDAGANGNIGPGPDGVVGTTDDGMPVTYNDFVKLLDKMVGESVIPFTWSGGTTYQRMYAYESIWANYEGLNDYRLNWTFDGTTSSGQTVTEANYKEVLSEQQGRKAAMKFFYDILNDQKYYSSKALSQAYNAAQFEYVDSCEPGNTRIAMFMEGGYWENEARTYFDDAAVDNPEMGYGKRDFRLLPIPNFTGTPGVENQQNTTDKEVLLGRANTSIICIPKTSKAKNVELQQNLAKLFLQFVQSRQQMSNFVRDTGAVFRPYSFEATEAEFAGWTKFGQNIYSYMQEGCEVVTDITKSTERLKYAEGFGWSFNYLNVNVTIQNPIDVFTLTTNKPTLDECFEVVKRELKK